MPFPHRIPASSHSGTTVRYFPYRVIWLSLRSAVGRDVGWGCWEQSAIKWGLFLRFTDPGFLFFFFFSIFNCFKCSFNKICSFFFLRSIEQDYVLEDICFTKNCVSLCHTSPQISHRYTHVPSLLSLPPMSLPSHPSRLSQNIGLSSLFYTANSHLLPVLHMVHKPVLHVCISTAALQIGSSVLSF